MQFQKSKMLKAGAVLLILALSVPISAQAAETAGSQSSGSRVELTVTVPERPEPEITVPEGTESLEDVPLPDGWHWKNPDQKPTPGTIEEFVAQYGDTEQEITVTVKTPPEILKDQSDTVYQIGKDKEVTIVCKGAKDALLGVEVNGETVAPSNYTVTEKNGITRITFKKSYLDGLKEGTYTITLHYGGGSDSIAVRVKKKPSGNENNGNNGNSENNGNNENNGNSGTGNKTTVGAKTGDATNLYGWIVTLGISLAVMGGMVFIQSRRKKGHSGSADFFI